MSFPDQEQFEIVRDELIEGQALTIAMVGRIFGPDFYHLLLISQAMGPKERRERIATAALQQWLSLYGSTWSGRSMPQDLADQIAKNAVGLADALMRAIDR
jgi:hypothetical protein